MWFMLGQLCLLMAVQAVSHHIELHEKHLIWEQIIRLQTGPDCQQWIGTVGVLQLCLISNWLKVNGLKECWRDSSPKNLNSVITNPQDFG